MKSQHIRFGLAFIFCLMAAMCFAQKTKVIKIKKPKPISTSESVSVLAENENIKHGPFRKERRSVLIEEGFYKNNQKDSIWHFYSSAGVLVASGKFKADERVGKWNYFTFSGVLVETYDFDTRSFLYYNQEEETKLGTITSPIDSTTIEQPPYFIGGTSYMHSILGNNLEYPLDAWNKEKQEKVFVAFTINPLGYAENIRVVSAKGNGFDEEAVRLVSLLGNDWIPAKMNNKPVPMQLILPIIFKLE